MPNRPPYIEGAVAAAGLLYLGLGRRHRAGPDAGGHARPLTAAGSGFSGTGGAPNLTSR
jgi:hypothetical protein